MTADPPPPTAVVEPDLDADAWQAAVDAVVLLGYGARTETIMRSTLTAYLSAASPRPASIARAARPSDLDLDAIREALKNATPGPWECHVESHTDITDERWTSVEVTAPVSPELRSGVVAMLGDDEQSEADAHLIANAPTWLSALLSALDEARREHERLRRALVAVNASAVETLTHVCIFNAGLRCECPHPTCRLKEADDG